MNIAARILNFSLMIAMPLGLAVYLSRKLKTEWRLFGVGVLTFILSQVFHIPFNIWLLRPLLQNLGLSLPQPGLQLAVVGLFYGLSAGLFEEITRYLGYRFWIKDERDWESALMYGAGHGGIEAPERRPSFQQGFYGNPGNRHRPGKPSQTESIQTEPGGDQFLQPPEKKYQIGSCAVYGLLRRGGDAVRHF